MTVLILVGGDNLRSEAEPGGFQGADYVIAADSGLHRAGGRHVDLIVGDFDSAEASIVEDARENGSELRRFPVAKDLTDLELALEAAAERSPDLVVIEGGFGGRFDHFLNTANVITSDRWNSFTIEWWDDVRRAIVVRGTISLSASPGSMVSLLPYGGSARGVTLRGFAFGLDHETLEAGSGRGLSNVIVAESASIAVADGTILAMFPDGVSS